MELYTTLEHILTIPNPADKINAFQTFYPQYLKNDFELDSMSIPHEFSTPSYTGFLEICDPKDVPRRTQLGTPHGQKLLLHAIAHIEYSAIDLALDAAYRFRNVDKEFTDDWLKVADDEVRHFVMIEKLLHELGSYYGEFPVHNALFEASQRTLTLLERMAVVPRYLEANGLDATPMILKKLEPFRSDMMVSKIIQALQIILDEEVDHVQRGDRWFHYACAHEQVDPSIYFEIIERHYPASFPRRVAINCTARKQAGFESGELAKISLTEC